LGASVVVVVVVVRGVVMYGVAVMYDVVGVGG